MATESSFAYLEKKHLKFIDSIFANVSFTKQATCLSNAELEDPYYNLSTGINLNDESREKWLEAIEKSGIEKKRLPCVYLTPETYPNYLEKLLLTRGYSLVFKDLWYSIEPKPLGMQVPANLEITEVSNNNDLNLFIDIFLKSFAAADPSKPEIKVSPAYRNVWERAYNSKSPDRTAYLYIVKLGGVGVACCALFHDSEAGCLYGGGVLPAYRGKQISLFMNQYRVEKAFKLGLSTVFVQVDADGVSQKNFESLGFKKVCECRGLQLLSVFR